MTKRILLIFFVLAAMILPATAATKTRHHKHSAARSRKSKSKTRATHHRSKKKLAKR
jgi:Flp pilus assembly protein TadB